jgi:hypothetical protein
MTTDRVISPGDLLSFKSRLIGRTMRVSERGHWLLVKARQGRPGIALIVASEADTSGAGQTTYCVTSDGVFFMYTHNDDELLCGGQ